MTKKERKKVERHRRIRKEKGFFTIESPTDVHKNCIKADIKRRTAQLYSSVYQILWQTKCLRKM